jgi:hypothetical protein
MYGIVHNKYGIIDFSQFDTDHDGFITREDVIYYFS